MPRVYGERIMLREYQKEDLTKMRKWVNDPVITDNLSDNFLYPHTVNDTEAYLNAILEGKTQQKGFVIAHKESGTYIGQIDLYSIDWKNRVAMLGIVIGNPEEHGKGYGSEAILLLQQFVFERMNLNKLELDVYDYNTSAYKCYVKCGFKEEGRKRQRYYHKGRYRDTILMGILRSEYEQRKREGLVGTFSTCDS